SRCCYAARRINPRATIRKLQRNLFPNDYAMKEPFRDELVRAVLALVGVQWRRTLALRTLFIGGLHGDLISCFARQKRKNWNPAQSIIRHTEPDSSWLPFFCVLQEERYLS